MHKRYAALAAIGCLLAAPVMAKGLSSKAQLSYSLGYQFGLNLRHNNVPVEPQIFTRAIRDALSGAKPLLPPTQMAAVVAKFQQQVRARNLAMLKQLGEHEQAVGRAFREQNAKKPGVKTLPSGVEYKVLVEGHGSRPTIDSTIEADYSGRFINGHLFATSKTTGKPAVFPLEGLIEGLREAIVLMPVGSTWQIVVPGHLAYGPEGRPAIPPNATLVFTIHLVAIKQ
ncbi:MAG TPA: FKBP-type peptidyl-prolyl cis-trans isomerase [Acidiferrobacter sp.]|nr:FKBP-type peptidyl-prolyl cis-trans isomerase [Acidiferrobacter sp.]